MFAIINKISNSDGDFYLFKGNEGKIININQFEEEYFMGIKLYCYDSIKNFLLFDKFKNIVFYDLKTLLELHGLKSSNEQELFKNIVDKELFDDYVEFSQRFSGHLNSYNIAKIDYKKHKYKTLFTETFINEAYESKCIMLKNIVETFNFDSEVIEYYETRFVKVLHELNLLSRQKVDINLESIKDSDDHSVNLLREITRYGKASIQFNPIGTKSGRLTTKKATVPILTMQKKIRKAITVPEDYEIYQFDYKSFQPRIAIFSTEDQVFKDKMKNVSDIYSIFEGDRNENKLLFLRWMFSLEYKNKEFETKAKAISELRDKIYLRCIEDRKIKNSFGRVLFFNDEDKNVIFQNFITSNEADLILEMFCKISELLRDKKSKIICPFHDAMIIKIHNSELEVVNKIKNIMENSFEDRIFFSKFMVDVKHGKNFGDLHA